MKDIAVRNSFIEMRAKGKSLRHIADKLGVCKQTCINWNKEYQHEITNLRSIEIDAICEKYRVQKRLHVEHLLLISGRIKNELRKRRLDDIKTKDLMELDMRYAELLGAECQEPFFWTTEEVEKAEEALLEICRN